MKQYNWMRYAQQNNRSIILSGDWELSPEIIKILNIEHNSIYHEESVLRHTEEVVKTISDIDYESIFRTIIPNNLDKQKILSDIRNILITAAALHDIGKQGRASNFTCNKCGEHTFGTECKNCGNKDPNKFSQKIKYVCKNCEANGKILKAQQFDQSNDRIYKHYTTPDSLEMTTAFTLSAWIYPFTTADNTGQYIIVRNSSSATAMQYGIYIVATTTIEQIGAYVHGTAKNLGTPGSTTDNWYHVVITFSKPTLNSYINGAYLGTGSYDSPVVGSGDFINIGGRSNSADGSTSARVIYGNIDEARISNIARSADWIATEYNNQNDPDSFYSIIIES